jgi:flagellar biosynthesis chaperone FliJ
MENVSVASHDKRKKRLERLADLIRRKLDSEVALLAQAQQAWVDSVTCVQSAVQQHGVAVQAARAKLAAGAEASQWQAEHAWEESLAACVLSARERSEQRAGELKTARTRVLVAHEDLQRMNALIKRVETSRRAELSRRERAAEDDMYAALASFGGKGELA